MVPAAGQVVPGVVPGQPQRQAQGRGLPVFPLQAQVAPGVALG